MESYSCLLSCQWLLFIYNCPQSSKKENASEGAGDTGGSEKPDADGSSDEDEGALVIDEKNERGGAKRKAEESAEVRLGLSVYQKLNRKPTVVNPDTCQTLFKASPKRPKDTEAGSDSKVDGNKSNAETKLNDVAAPKATTPSAQSELKPEAQENAAAGGQLTAEKVRHVVLL